MSESKKTDLKELIVRKGTQVVFRETRVASMELVENLRALNFEFDGDPFDIEEFGEVPEYAKDPFGILQLFLDLGVVAVAGDREGDEFAGGHLDMEEVL